MKLSQLSKGLKTAYSQLEHDPGDKVKHFDGWMGRAKTRDIDTKGDEYDHSATVKDYYDLCSPFMAYGWSESLHFAPLTPSESLEESIVRHQRLMISKLELKQGMKVIDVGCGLGGPMRRVVSEAGVEVVGINNNHTQLHRAKKLNKEAGLTQSIKFIACSFMDMNEIEDGTFDRGYAIESTCHAPDKVGAFAEIFRVLKPGALLWGQEMCLTDKFDANDENHQFIKRELMHGIALKDIFTGEEVNQALEKVGFRIIEAFDRNIQDGPSIPWHRPMESGAGQGTLNNLIVRLPMGRKIFFGASKLAEVFGVFPKGSSKVIQLMDRTARAYVSGGSTGVFTPLYCFLAQKPL